MNPPAQAVGRVARRGLRRAPRVGCACRDPVASDPWAATLKRLMTSDQARGRDGGPREERRERSGTGCSSHGVTGRSTTTVTSSGSRTHCGSNNAWSSTQTPGRNAASTMMAMQKPATDRRGLSMSHRYSSGFPGSSQHGHEPCFFATARRESVSAARLGWRGWAANRAKNRAIVDECPGSWPIGADVAAADFLLMRCRPRAANGDASAIPVRLSMTYLPLP